VLIGQVSVRGLNELLFIVFPLGNRIFCNAHIVFEFCLKEENEYIFSTFSRAFQQDVHCCEISLTSRQNLAQLLQMKKSIVLAF
jgi:hypothetical protein